MQKTLQRSGNDFFQIDPGQHIRDPSVGDSCQVLYCREHSFIIKIQQRPEVLQSLSEPELIRVKVMVQYEHEFPKYLKIELTSDSEMYFNFIFECNDWEFKRIKSNQNFFIEFREYPDFILKNFERVAMNSDKFVATFTIFSQTQGRLDLIRKSEFKDDNIMEFQFKKAKDEQIRESIQYRYNLMRYEYQQYRAKYDGVCELIKQKNPSLAIQIQKIHKK